MMLPELTDEQRAILAPSVSVVEAGPGAGKTRSLVARFLTETARCAGGVALLSFTNAAIDEARDRACTVPEVLKAPNFVGTIDSFLNRFILTPWVSQQYECEPRYHATWALMAERRRTIRHRDVPGVGLPLDAFVPGTGRSARIDLGMLSKPQEDYLAELDAIHARGWAELEAWKRIEQSMKRGVFNATWARWATERVLAGTDG